MRYYNSGRNFRNLKPQKGWRSGKNQRKRKFVQYDEIGAGRYENPFAKKSKGNLSYLKTYFFASLFFAWIGLLLYLPYFRVTNFQYSGLHITNQPEFESLIKSSLFKNRPWLPANNYFFVNEDALARALQDKFLLNAITVAKVFPNTLKISVVEKTTSAIYDNSLAYYLIDSDGTVVKFLRNVAPNEFVLPTSTASTSIGGAPALVTTSSPASSSLQTASSTRGGTHIPDFNQIYNGYGNYPLIYDESAPQVKEKDRVLDGDTIKGVLAFYDSLNKNRIAKVSYCMMQEASAGVTAFTDHPWKIMFQPKGDIEKQITNLQIILKNSQPTEYIDLRFGDRIFWK